MNSRGRERVLRIRSAKQKKKIHWILSKLKMGGYQNTSLRK